MSTVLVINSGSSSIKYQLVDPDRGTAMASGLVEKIGEAEGHIRHRNLVAGTEVNLEEPVPNHQVGMEEVLRLFEQEGPGLAEAGVAAVGHRVVQGGKYFAGPALVTDETKRLIDELSPLGPLHNPPALVGIEVAQSLLPDVPHVVVFDTAFFQDLPARSALYALDRAVAEKYSIRRYGAHGTSHQYVSSLVSDMLGRDDLKQIVLHLGNGASASAIVNGHAVDTSMGLTPLEGLVMGTRTGDIDPAVVFHLQRVGGMSVDEVDTLMNRGSGLKGLAGDNDMRAVQAAADAGDVRAREALEVYTNRLIKYIGSYAAEMGGLDVISFTAGIGENQASLRTAVAERLAPFGVRISEAANAVRSDEPRTISTPDSTVRIMVVPTNEELAIAKQAMSLA